MKKPSILPSASRNPTKMILTSTSKTKNRISGNNRSDSKWRFRTASAGKSNILPFRVLKSPQRISSLTSEITCSENPRKKISNATYSRPSTNPNPKSYDSASSPTQILKNIYPSSRNSSISATKMKSKECTRQKTLNPPELSKRKIHPLPIHFLLKLTFFQRLDYQTRFLINYD